jgi:eukaryotic-like serine/threonine-protein kinase
VFEPGTTIGAYRVLHKLGEGGMGVVYVGEHTLLGRKAAIKVLLPTLSANDELLQRFFNEARAVTQIADPGIVQVFDFGQGTDGSAFIVMELLEGESFEHRLARVGRFSLIECLRLMRMICRSLRVAHARGIVHRDLKPENLFVVGDPAVTGGERPKILDFGIAKLSSTEPGALKTRTGIMMGTPVYMSPEQCRGAGDIDHRSDIYSIGCVMVTMLTGRPPFEGEATGDLIVAHLREPPPLVATRLPGTPEVIDQIVQRCLAKSPADRFGSMAELVAALDAAELMMERVPAGGLVRTATARTTAPPIPARVTTIARAPVTTLGAAAGHALAPRPGRARSRETIVALVLATAAIASVLTTGIAYVVTHARRGPELAARPSPLPASPSAAPLPAPPAHTEPAAAPPDAGLVDAAPDPVPPDATVPGTATPDTLPPRPTAVRPHRATPPRRTIDHENPTSPTSPAVDRGD